MSRHGAHGKGGRGDAKSGGGRRIPQLERKDTGSGVLNTGSVERSLITLTVSINADDLRKFFLVLGNHAASIFDTGVVERVFLEIPTYKYKMPDFPREPLPDDEEEVEEDNPDFDPEVEESADNPRLILVSKKIYTQNHIGLTVEGKRRLDVAVRMWERELTKRDKKIDAVQLELRRGFRLAYSHMDESAKSHMTTNFVFFTMLTGYSCMGNIQVRRGLAPTPPPPPLTRSSSHMHPGRATRPSPPKCRTWARRRKATGRRAERWKGGKVVWWTNKRRVTRQRHHSRKAPRYRYNPTLEVPRGCVTRQEY